MPKTYEACVRFGYLFIFVLKDLHALCKKEAQNKN